MGSLIAYSWYTTGRSPKEKRVVVEETSKDKVWWGDIDGPKKSPNMPISEEGWRYNYNRGISYLNTVPQLFVVDGYASHDERYKITVRVICTKAYHALFMRNMLIRPTPE
jgi:phosphoenolpyruvate carboxykinase (ATP)